MSVSKASQRYHEKLKDPPLSANKIAVLFTAPNSIYERIPGCDCWGVDRDARNYCGPHPVVAHPPCARWGRYWQGSPLCISKGKRLIKGNDQGCFAAAIWAVRTFGGVLEHPANSHAWPWFGLAKPQRKGGWIPSGDSFGGQTCCVEQYRYGHRAQKATWLYAVGHNLPELDWGKSPTGTGIWLEGGLSKSQRRRKIRTGRCQRLSHRERAATPQAFAELLISIVKAGQAGVANVE